MVNDKYICNMMKKQIMGILNITPDSFYDGGKYSSVKGALIHTEKMLSEGASIIDIGAYSSRPGAADISAEEEYNRLSPVISQIRKSFPTAQISIDTFRSEIVTKIYSEYGNIIVNDISGGLMDSQMLEVCGKHSLPYVCMHMNGTPQTMQNNTEYNNLIEDISSFFDKQIAKAEEFGINTIIIDPGFGFGKTTDQNFTLLSNLQEFTKYNKPILVGFSRKSMIYKTLNCTPENAGNGTTILNTIALLKGASILRVHDVKEAVETIALYQKI